MLGYTAIFFGWWCSLPFGLQFLSDWWLMEFGSDIRLNDEKNYKKRLKKMKKMKQYSVNDELAINRQKESKPEEFQEYFDYCEWAKNEAK